MFHIFSLLFDTIVEPNMIFYCEIIVEDVVLKTETYVLSDFVKVIWVGKA